MLGLGVSEVIIILIVALVVLGPTKLPQVARQVGKGLREFRRAASDLQHTFDEVAREAEREERAAEAKKLVSPPDNEPIGYDGSSDHAPGHDALGRPTIDENGHPISYDSDGHAVIHAHEPGAASLAPDAVASASGDVTSSTPPTDPTDPTK